MKIKNIILILAICLVLFSFNANAARIAPLQFFGWDEISLTAGTWDDLWNYFNVTKTMIYVYKSLNVSGDSYLGNSASDKVMIDGQLNATGNITGSYFCLKGECISNWTDVGGGSGTESEPIGSVIAWLKSYAGTPTLPEGWVECNGQILNDAESVYDGQIIPDLNGATDADKLFLRGAATSGGTGGSTNHRHGGHITTVGQLYKTNYGTMTVTGTSTICKQGCGGGAAASATVYKTSPADVVVVPPFYEVVWIMKVKGTGGFSGGTSNWNISGNDIYNANTGNVGIGTDYPAEKLHVSGNTRLEGNLNISGNIDMNNNKIENLATPTTNTDAATKAYVDSSSGGIGVPIGTVISFLKDYTGAATLAELQADGWALCDGTTPAAQGIAGAVITTTPDLNDQNRFLRGAGTSGGTGGSSSHSHSLVYPADTSWSWTTDAGRPLMHSVGSGAWTRSWLKTSTVAANSLPPYYEVVWLIKVK